MSSARRTTVLLFLLCFLGLVYNKYVGRDNDRDAMYANLQETANMMDEGWRWQTPAVLKLLFNAIFYRG